ncbi:MAG: endonuclease/exonuclease/phosphatase family protein [Saprospiraceae bacterium]|nr:endonuclease/exonuclease/phosphatase family protein [Saprospiraceae bacterium]
MSKQLLLLALFLTCTNLPAQPLTVITYNLRYDNPGDGEDAWPKRRDFLAAQLRFQAPDIFGIQEGLHHQLVFLQEQFPDFAMVGVGRDDGRQAGEYSSLFYRKSRFRMLDSGTFWLSETPDSVSKGWDAALPRVCTWAHLEDLSAQRNIWVFNSHFDHIGKQARIESAALILQKIKEKNTAGEPVICMGDLNSEPQEEPLLRFRQVLQDTRDQSQEPPFGPEGTFNGFRFQEPVTRRIDYILVSPGLRVRQHAILSDSRNCHYPSDHLPVLARIE